LVAPPPVAALGQTTPPGARPVVAWLPAVPVARGVRRVVPAAGAPRPATPQGGRTRQAAQGRRAPSRCAGTRFLPNVTGAPCARAFPTTSAPVMPIAARTTTSVPIPCARWRMSRPAFPSSGKSPAPTTHWGWARTAWPAVLAPGALPAAAPANAHPASAASPFLLAELAARPGRSAILVSWACPAPRVCYVIRRPAPAWPSPPCFPTRPRARPAIWEQVRPWVARGI
jgi:hypothetical protein